MDVKIDKLSHDFRGITRINNKVTFVDNTLPDEVVDIEIINEKKNYNEGKVISYIKKSCDRVDSKCPYSNRCGGCEIDYINYDKQLEYKKNMVIDIFDKYTGIKINPDIIFDNNNYNYRNKITFKVYNGKLSLMENNSNNCINVNKCLLANDSINNVIKLFDNINISLAYEVIIRGNDEIMVIINGEVNINDIILKLKDNVNSIIVNDKVVYGSDYIIINVDKYRYVIYPKSFFQVNTNMISKLYDKVKEYAGYGNKLLDLYCGAGTIGIYLSDNFKEVYGVEINSDAVKGANVNKDINNVNNIKFSCMNSNEIDINGYDTVVVDPPRSGLDNTTINKLVNADTKKIVYVSCNPITLARDINILKNKYELNDIVLFDNFPNTSHVETVCVLERR